MASVTDVATAANATAPISSASRASASSTTDWMPATSRVSSAGAGLVALAQVGQAGGALADVVGQLEPVAVLGGGELEHVGDHGRQLGGDLLGRQLADLLQRRALDHPHQPRLGQVLPRAVQPRQRPA